MKDATKGVTAITPLPTRVTEVLGTVSAMYISVRAAFPRELDTEMKTAMARLQLSVKVGLLVPAEVLEAEVVAIDPDPSYTVPPTPAKISVDNSAGSASPAVVVFLCVCFGFYTVTAKSSWL